MGIMKLAAVFIALFSISQAAWSQSYSTSLPTDAFTIVALPDTQYYQDTYKWAFTDQLSWIVNHRNDTDKKIKLVLGLGDIVDGGGPPQSGSCKVAPPSTWQSQWQNASSAVNTYLDGNGIPYMFAIGNHDYDCEADHTTGIPQSRSAYHYNNYFGAGRYTNKSWWNGSRYSTYPEANFYNTFTINGIPYLVIALEFYPRNSTLGWANAVITNHPGSRVIIITHAYLFPDTSAGPGTGHPVTTGDSDSASSYNLGPSYPEGSTTTCGTKKCSNGNNGSDMWTKLISKHKNIIMVLNGHFRLPSPGNTPPNYNGVGYKTQVTSLGNRLNEFCSDYQGQGNNGYFGKGYLRMYTVIPSQGIIKVRTYSPPALYHPSLFPTPGAPSPTRTDIYNQYSVPYADPL